MKVLNAVVAGRAGLTKATLWMFLLLCLSVASSMVACDDDDDDNGNLPAGDIWPLAVGNTWTYEYEEGSGQMVVYAVTGTESVGGVEVFRTDLTSTLYLLLKNHSDGVYVYGDSGEIFQQPGLWLRYPTHEGDSWTDFEGSAMRVASTSARVTVPAGEFVCVEYVVEESVHTFYSPSVGMVKTSIQFDEATVTLSLVGYDLM